MTYDEEFVSTLELLGFQILVESQESWFEVLEKKFPIGLNRIAWKSVNEVDMISLGKLTENKEEVKEKILSFILTKFDQVNINDAERLIVLSDGALEETYSIVVSDLKQIFEHVLFLPQHTYIIPQSGEWCLNYTFEDDLYFGLTPTAVAP